MATQTTPSVTVTDNRDATKEDAKILARVYRALVDATKVAKSATRAVTDGWVYPDSLEGLRSHRDAAQVILDGIMDKGWTALTSMPRGVVAGQATPQTVGLQFFNRNLNRNLKLRLTASEAKQINKLSFGC